MKRKTAKKEERRPTCAAPKLVYDSALLFETFHHVYVRTKQAHIFGETTPRWWSRDGYVQHVGKRSGSLNKRRA